MSFELKDIAYGWRIGIAAVLTGTTIFVADNVRQRIMQKDAVQIIMGTVERCYATQLTTNPTYAVDPPSFVRNWYSNDYVATVTNGVTNWTAVLYTNVFTNVIGDRLDHQMMVDLDAKIFALIPYYVDTNTVYDGTTNIVMLTVTGLFASLQIGDHTNQFTAIPCWTNNVGQTNCTTNAATYGPWAWRNYVVAWQERYKVLNALTCVKLPSAFDVVQSYKRTMCWNWPLERWDTLPDFIEVNQMAISTAFTNTTGTETKYFDDAGQITTNTDTAHGDVYQTIGSGNTSQRNIGVDLIYWPDNGTNKYLGGIATKKLIVTGPKMLNTNLQTIKSFCQQYIFEGPCKSITYYTPVDPPVATNVFHSYYSGDEIYTNEAERTVKEFPLNHVFSINYPTPEFQTPCNVQGQHDIYGASYVFINSESYLFPQFNYCTSRFWE